MSLLRLGLNPDGTRHTSDLGPNIGRCVARGGLPLSQALTSVTSWKRPDLKRRIPRAPLNRNPPRLRTRPRCGYLMPIAKEYCNRMPGHTHSHRSARIMAEDSERRHRRRCRHVPNGHCLCGGSIEAETLDACDGPMTLHVASLTHQIWRGVREGRFPGPRQEPTVRIGDGDLSQSPPNASAPAVVRRLT